VWRATRHPMALRSHRVSRALVRQVAQVALPSPRICALAPRRAAAHACHGTVDRSCLVQGGRAAPSCRPSHRPANLTPSGRFVSSGQLALLADSFIRALSNIGCLIQLQQLTSEDASHHTALHVFELAHAVGKPRGVGGELVDLGGQRFRIAVRLLLADACLPQPGDNVLELATKLRVARESVTNVTYSWIVKSGLISFISANICCTCSNCPVVAYAEIRSV
jgi:hypothetical protein